MYIQEERRDTGAEPVLAQTANSIGDNTKNDKKKSNETRPGFTAKPGSASLFHMWYPSPVANAIAQSASARIERQ